MSTRIRFRLPARRALARCALAALLTGAVLSVGAATQAHAATNDGDIYVVNEGSGSVSVVDPTTDTVVATLPVGLSPEGVAVSPDGSQAWVTNYGDGDVFVISTATNTVTGTVRTGGVSTAIAFSPDGTRAYVAIVGLRREVSSIAVIDTSTDTVTATIPLDGLPVPAAAIAVSPDGSTVYVANGGFGVSVIDAATDTVTATISGDGLEDARSVTFSPDGTLAYVADPASGVVYVINTATNTIIDRFAAGDDPVDVSLTTYGDNPYVADANANTVSVVNSATDAVIATIPVGESPLGILLSSDDTTAYTANQGSNDVSVIDAASNRVTATIPVGSGPVALAQARQPEILNISPDTGVLGGGTTVTITGTGLDLATAVSFGGIPATSFTVNSDISITAIAPPAAAIGQVQVTVTSPTGTSPPLFAPGYMYIYPFSGFLAPVANPPATNVETAGQAIPVQFSLGGNQGLGILGRNSPFVQQVDCSNGTPIGNGSLAASAGNSGLQYDAGTGTYTFVWKTAKAYAGTCQQFLLGLNDGTVYTANFTFS